MERMLSEEKQKIIETLAKKMATKPCPRCSQKKFTLLDGVLCAARNIVPEPL